MAIIPIQQNSGVQTSTNQSVNAAKPGIGLSRRIINRNLADPNKQLDTLVALGKSSGLPVNTEDITKPKKLSFLQKLGAGLTSFETGNAAYEATNDGGFDLGKFGKTYIKDIGTGIAAAVTGDQQFYQPDKKTYKDIAERQGIDNAVAKFGIGLAGDILFDPSTYFGGWAAKQVGKGIGKTAAKGVSLIDKAAPGFKEGVEKSTGAIADAFVLGRGANKAVIEGGTTAVGKAQSVTKELSEKLQADFAHLSKPQREMLAESMIKAKALEFKTASEGKDVFIKSLELSKTATAKLARSDNGKIIDALETATAKKTDKLQKALDALLKDDVKKGTGDLLDYIQTLKKAIRSGGTPSLGKVVDDLAEPTAKELDDIIMSVVYPKRQELERTIAELENVLKLSGGKEMLAGQVSLKASKKALIKKLNDEIIATQNKVSDNIGELLSIRGRGFEAGKQAIANIPDQTVRETAQKTAESVRKFTAENTDLDPTDLYYSYWPTNDITKTKKALSGMDKLPQGLRPGQENWRKQYKNLVDFANIEKDPATAFFKVQAEQLTNKIYREELDGVVKNFGLPLKSFATKEAAEKAGYRLLREKGGVFGKELGWVTEADHKFLQTMMSPDTQFAGIDKLAKATGFDAVTNLFKRSVTGLFAPFHVRNYVSGFIQGYEEVGARVFDPRAIAWSQKIGAAVATDKPLNSVVNINGIDYNLESIKNLIVERFGLVQGMATEGNQEKLAPVAKFFSGKALKTTLKNPIGADSQLFKGARVVTNFTEVQNKANIVIASLLNGDDMQKAIMHAEKGAFDYRAMTAFESKVLRRVIPFYAYTRKNIELQARTLATNPQRVSNIFKTVRDLGSNMSAEEQQNLPDYMKQAFNIKTGTDEYGQAIVTSQLGTPVEQVAQLFSGNPILNAISQMNPILKVPLELGTGKDSFRERDIKLTYDAKEYAKAPSFLKKFLQMEEIQKPVYKNGKPTGESKTQYVSNPERLLAIRSLFTSRGVSYLEKVFNGDVDKFSKALSLTTGVKPQVIDEDTTKYFKEKEQTDKLLDILQRYNRINRFTSPYVPKNSIRRQQ